MVNSLVRRFNEIYVYRRNFLNSQEKRAQQKASTQFSLLGLALYFLQQILCHFHTKHNTKLIGRDPLRQE